MQDALL